MAIAPRTGALFNRSAVGGVYAILSEEIYPGAIYFVSSTSPVAVDVAGGGLAPDAPYASIKFAISQCVADQGDVIIVLPNHTEACIAAGTINLNVAGVRIKGLGKRYQRPIITYTTAAAASFNITAARCSVENIVFKPLGVASVTSAVNVSASDCVINNCEFELANGTNQCVAGVTTTAAADRFTFTNNMVHGTTNAGTNAALVIVGGDSLVVQNNFFIGAYGAAVGAISNITAATTNTMIQFNYINNETAVSTKAITMVAGSSGMISDNNMQILSGAAPLTGAAMSWVGCNYYAAALATAGTLI